MQGKELSGVSKQDSRHLAVPIQGGSNRSNAGQRLQQCITYVDISVHEVVGQEARLGLAPAYYLQLSDSAQVEVPM